MNSRSRSTSDDIFKEPKISARSQANWLSKLFICWALPIFQLGNKRTLKLGDLSPIQPNQASEALGNPLVKNWENELCKKNPSFLKALFKTYFLSFVSIGIFFFLRDCVVQIAISLAFAKFLRAYDDASSSNDKNALYNSGAVFLLLSIIYSFMTGHFQLKSMELGFKMATSVTEIIYRKTLKTGAGALNSAGSGNLINLITSDTKRFEAGIGTLHAIWAGPLILIAVLFILLKLYGLASLAGLLTMLVLTVGYMFIGKWFGTLRARIATRTDSRLKIMSEIIDSIQIIKIYAWESLFISKLNTARLNEIRAMVTRNGLMAFSLNLQTLFSRITIFTTLLAYLASGTGLDVEKVFVVISFYNIVAGIMSTSFPSSMLQLMEIRVAGRRIQTFLELPYKSKEGIQHLIGLPEPFMTKGRIKIENFSGSWNPEESNDQQVNCIENVNLTVKAGERLFIIGPVGSGKTSLLSGILGDLETKHGKIEVEGTIGYAAQSPWAFSGTIRENIIFGRNYEPKWYAHVLKLTALEHDLRSMPSGDLTIVGDKGITLSGGQKCRINLARAIYTNADVFLLDDVFSSLDPIVAREIFDNLVKRHLRNKCVVIVTHLLGLIDGNEKVALMKSGSILEVGFRVIVSVKHPELFSELTQEANEEKQKQVVRKRKNSFAEFQSMSLDIPHPKKQTLLFSESTTLLSSISPEEQKEGTLGLGFVWKYWKFGNTNTRITFGILFLIGTQMITSLLDVYLSMWTNNPQLSASWTPCYVYFSILISTFFIGWGTNFLYFYIGLYSAYELHKESSYSLIKAPLLFFEQNPGGTILNRFSKDMSNLDEYLPLTMFGALNCGLQVLGSLVVACVLNPWLAIPGAGMLYVFVRMRSFYIPGSTDIKRLEAIARSPVFSLFTSTVDGIITIQGLKQEEFLLRRFRRLKDTHSSAYYSYVGTFCWFTLFISLIIQVFQFFVLVAFIFLVTNKSGAALVLTTMFSMNTVFAAAIQRSADLENDLISVERLLEYKNLKPEGSEKEEKGILTASWRHRLGHIQINKLNVLYNNSTPALQDINLDIPQGTKLGIVGRTGAGKSTLVSTILRLVEPFSGEILIDGINIQNLSLRELRSGISVITQTPGFFEGTLRDNLDPFGVHSDDEIILVLREVKMSKKIGTSIYQNIEKDARGFSLGEQQLLCLARILLQNSSIVILDEPSANLDLGTDALIQKLIEECYESKTVITIAHRIETLKNCDKICVLEGGKVVEYDSPNVVFFKPE